VNSKISRVSEWTWNGWVNSAEQHGGPLTWVLHRAVSLRDELFGGCRMAVVHAEDVDAEHALEIFGRQVKEAFHLRDAGVGDHGVQRSQFPDACLDHFLDLAQYGDVPQCNGGLPA